MYSFLIVKVLLSCLAYTYFRVRPFNSIQPIPKLDPLCRSRSVRTLSFTPMFKFCVVLKSVQQYITAEVCKIEL